MPPSQSAYRRHHSTKTALVKALSDILEAADSRQVTLLGLLDLSAAFDTVDHDILLRRLQTSFGISGITLRWLKSFLTERTQAVTHHGHVSTYRLQKYGVPQGSVLGPLLFILYTSDIHRIAGECRIRVHSYADDTQLYVTCFTADRHASMDLLQACIDKLHRWMCANRLKLNTDKTQFVWLGSPFQLKDLSLDKNHAIRNLGVMIDAHLSVRDHVNSVVRSCFYQLRQLRHIRHSLTTEAVRTLVHALIATRIDYCNAILYGVSATVLRRLQAVLNAAARLISGVRRNDHITPVMRELHWLPVNHRISYKVAMMTFDCLRGQCPAYLKDVCKPVCSMAACNRLRSAARGDLIVPRTRTVRFGPRSFYVAAPVVWNSLPSNLKSPVISREVFRKHLKTWFFSLAYPQEAPL